jgi:23S rRNA maturation mini-RNase III
LSRAGAPALDEVLALQSRNHVDAGGQADGLSKLGCQCDSSEDVAAGRGRNDPIWISIGKGPQENNYAANCSRRWERCDCCVISLTPPASSLDYSGQGKQILDREVRSLLAAQRIERVDDLEPSRTVDNIRVRAQHPMTSQTPMKHDEYRTKVRIRGADSPHARSRHLGQAHQEPSAVRSHRKEMERGTWHEPGPRPTVVSVPTCPRVKSKICRATPSSRAAAPSQLIAPLLAGGPVSGAGPPPSGAAQTRCPSSSG